MTIVSIDVGIKNMAACVLSLDKETIEFVDMIDLRKGPNLRDCLIIELEKLRPRCKDVQVVLVEQQLKKVYMVLAAYIEMWFKLNFPDSRVLCYSARHKLASVKNDGQKWTYSQRKRASINHVNQWLIQHPQEAGIMEQWNEFKKKDDIADSICQALSYKPTECKTKQNLVARAPPQHHNKRLYALSHIKYLLQHGADVDTDEKLRLSVAKFYSGIEECRTDLGLL